MGVLRYNEFITEMRGYDTLKNSAGEYIRNTPLAGISFPNGKDVSLRLWHDEDDFENMPRYKFTFRLKREMEDFTNTTASREFWLAIYDWDKQDIEPNDYDRIQANMHKFGNVILGKDLFIYAYEKSDIKELKERCEKAAGTFEFKSVKPLLY
jgi:hypothetical protein